MPPRASRQYVNYSNAIVAAILVVGPALGGAIATYIGVRAVFLISFLICIGSLFNVIFRVLGEEGKLVSKQMKFIDFYAAVHLHDGYIYTDSYGMPLSKDMCARIKIDGSIFKSKIDELKSLKDDKDKYVGKYDYIDRYGFTRNVNVYKMDKHVFWNDKGNQFPVINMHSNSKINQFDRKNKQGGSFASARRVLTFGNIRTSFLSLSPCEQISLFSYILALSLYSSTEAIIGTWWYTYVTNTWHGTQVESNGSIAVSAMCVCLFLLIATHLQSLNSVLCRDFREFWIIGGSLVMIGALTVFPLSTHFYWIWVFAIWYGLGFGIVMGVLEVIVVEETPKEHSGKIQGVRAIALAVTRGLGTLCVGTLWDSGGQHHFLFHICSIIVVLAMIFTVFGYISYKYVKFNKDDIYTHSRVSTPEIALTTPISNS